MGSHADAEPGSRMSPRPAPGLPYTLFLRQGWYTPRAQTMLARLGFHFEAPNAVGQAQPCVDGIVLGDRLLSDLLALLRPLRLTLSVCQARHWYGEPLRKDEFFWYLCLHKEP